MHHNSPRATKNSHVKQRFWLNQKKKEEGSKEEKGQICRVHYIYVHNNKIFPTHRRKVEDFNPSRGPDDQGTFGKDQILVIKITYKTKVLASST